MSERDVIKSLIDFAFMIKAQLHSEKTDLLKSILSIAIMESEDIIEMIDEAMEATNRKHGRSAHG